MRKPKLNPPTNSKPTSKPKPVVVGESVIDGGGITRTWANSPGTYIAGQAFIDEADKLAAAAETKWGCGRLRLLVGPELRERFDRQRYLFNQAIWHGQLEDVRREAGRMCAAWRAVDAEAERLGAGKLDPQVMEVVLADGRVAAIVPDNDHARLVTREDRRMDVYTLEEIARLLDGFPELAKVKESFPGSEVVAARRSIGDPLDAIHDTGEGLEESF
jgi:hypothetical protein